MLREREIPARGIKICMWDIPERGDLRSMRSELEAIGMGRLAPKQRRPLSCLKSAAFSLRLFGSANKVVELDDKTGIAIIGSIQSDMAPGANWGKIDIVLKITEGRIATDPHDQVLEDKVTLAYLDEREKVDPLTISSILVKAAMACRAIPLRSHGGVYAIRDDYIQYWQRVCVAITRSSSGGDFHVFSHTYDADGARAIYSNIVRNASNAVEKAMEKLTNEDEPLGVKALSTQCAEMNRLVDELESHEKYFGLVLEEVKESAAKAARLASASGLVLMAKERCEEGVEEVKLW